MESIRVHYQVRCAEEDLAKISRGIALEQTLEVPEELVTRHDLEGMLGKVVDILPAAGGEGVHHVTIAYDPRLSAYQFPQLLNLIFGNISFQDDVRIIDLEFPPALLERFPGPRHGIAGIRARLGVYGRPLLATALKPRGLNAEAMAALAGEFAAGGGDIVKDDHNVVDASMAGFRDRVRRTQEAVKRANTRGGGVTLYFPNLCLPSEEIDQAMEFLIREGIEGVMVAPMIAGIDQTRRLAEIHGLIMLAHPTFSGGAYVSPRHGMEHGILLGTLFRMAGIDISVFVNCGGRFAFTREQCIEIGRRLRAPLGNLLPAFPAPAGGMRFGNINEMGRDFGEDAVFLIGGALFCYSDDLRKSTETFLKRVQDIFPGRQEIPAAAATARAARREQIHGSPAADRLGERLGERIAAHRVAPDAPGML